MSKIAVKLISSWNSDKDIAKAAWASTQTSKRSDNDIFNLLTNQIVPNHHHTPKEVVWLLYQLHVPIFVERQLDKYRMTNQIQNISYDFGPIGRDNITQNELSLRYRTMPNTFYRLPKEIVDILIKIDRPELIDEYVKLLEKEEQYYTAAITSLKIDMEENKICRNEFSRIREVLRGVLGTSFFTDMQIQLNLNSLEHIANQRLTEHAQPETRETVRQMIISAIESEVAPITINAMIKENKWNL